MKERWLIDSREKAIRIARLCDERKGEDIAVLHVEPLCSFTDYLVIVTGTSANHLRALSQSFVPELKGRGLLPLGAEGEQTGGWLLIDYGDVVVHLFLAESRAYYALERLWGDATETVWSQDAGVAV